MPQTHHVEKHFTSSKIVRDIVIGMADGLTVPFALAAGLTGAIAATNIIVTAGFAEIAAGSIAMGLGGYLAAKGDAEHYSSEKRREQLEIIEKPDLERREVAELLEQYGLTGTESATVVEAISKRPKEWVDFMMRFELGLEQPEPKRALMSAMTIASAYIFGGLIPLAPYVFADQIQSALIFSVTVTMTALAVFGYIKGHFTGISKVKSALQTLLIGGLAAGAAYWIAGLFS